MIFELKAQFYNGAEQQFGKNRVQYQEFFWQYIRKDRFDVYYYKGGENLAERVAEEIELSIPLFEQRFQELISDRLDIVVYKSYSDFKQSNIGYEANEDYNIGGTTTLMGNKFFIYYTGEELELSQQIRKGLAALLIEQGLYGGSLQERVRSSAMLNLPQWYQTGMERYFSEGWTVENKNLFKGEFLAGNLNDFNRITNEQASLAGLALWNFVAEKYGEQVFSDILSMTSLTRSTEEAFYFILGKEMESLFAEYNAFYKQRFESELGSDLSEFYEPIENFKSKKRRTYTQAKVSKNGKYLAYVNNELGQYRVYIQDLKEGSNKRILKNGHKMLRPTDYTHPVITWHPTRNIIAIATEEKGKCWLYIYKVSDGSMEKKELFAMDKVLAMDYHPDGKNMVFSAVSLGRTNLYKYFLVGKFSINLFSGLYS